MSYITTQHEFYIDEKHPEDVFEEMTDFFNMYSANIDYLRDLSVRLSLPNGMDLGGSSLLEARHQAFIKAIKYVAPSVSLFPIQSHSETSVAKLTLQYFEDSYASQNSIYHKILTAILPQFDHQTSSTGWINHSNTNYQTLSPQPTSTNQSAPQPSSNNNSTKNSGLKSASQQKPTATPTNYAFNNKIIERYREVLTQKVYKTAVAQSLSHGSQSNSAIRSITFIANDGISSAFIEYIFSTFEKPSQTGAIDLSSYIQNELYPTLKPLNYNFSDSLNFLMQNQVPASYSDKQAVKASQFDLMDLNFDVKLDFIKNKNSTTQSSMPVSKPTSNKPVDLTMKASIDDALGERTIVIRSFPVLFASASGHKHVKVVSSTTSSIEFRIYEDAGNLYLENNNDQYSILVNDRPIHTKQILMPGDKVRMGNDVFLKFSI